MTLEGTFQNGVIVLDQPEQIPEGTRVRVVVEDEDRTESPLASLLKYAGMVKDLPPDFAAQHDHYLYGTPKR